ncbi:SRPBCC family protein [Edaphobacter flagellatus]|uniref:SRPBCC family protein n=1 Tax=Edaphobacter flagellatus TaxID=1933044 RepID=UPI0021B3E9F5|nr:SRPBCC domain-containing protein [Edaphobacter flagellatus]
MSNSAAENTRTLVIERTFAHSPEKLWRALTESSLVAEWLLKNDFEPIVGRKFRFHSQPMPQWDGAIDCEVLVVDPLKQLSYSWNALGLESVVLFTLIPAEGGTHLRMEHSGFRPDQQQAYGGAKYGWQNFLNNLERVLHGGVK